MAEKEKIADSISSVLGRYSGKRELEQQINRLQSHIVELELDLSSATKKYERSAESEKKAIAAKQDAEEKLKASLIRLQTLEHELEKYKNESSGDLSYSRVDQLSRERTLDILRSVSSFRSSSSMLTVYLAAGDSLEQQKDHEHLTGQIDSKSLHLLERVSSSTGFVFFYSPDHLINEIIIPPVPVLKSRWQAGSSFDTGEIENSLDIALNICVLVAHAGESFIGYSAGMDEFDSFQIIKSSVKAKHAKGGFSQRRFERLREEDIAHHAGKVKSALKEMIEEYEGNIDYLFTAGDPQLSREITMAAPIDLKQVVSLSDIRIEKHNIQDILKQLTACRRYRL